MCIGAAQVFWCRFDAQQMYESLCAQTSDVFCFLGCRNASTAAELINGSCTMLLFLYSTSQKFNSLRKRVQTSDWYPAPNKTKANWISISTKGRLHESTRFIFCTVNEIRRMWNAFCGKSFFSCFYIKREDAAGHARSVPPSCSMFSGGAHWFSAWTEVCYDLLTIKQPPLLMQLVHVALAPSSDRKCKHTYTLV